MIGPTNSGAVQNTIATAIQQGGAQEKINTPQQQPLAETAQPRQAASAETQTSSNDRSFTEQKPALEGFARKNAEDASAPESTRPGQILDISV